MFLLGERNAYPSSGGIVHTRMNDLRIATLIGMKTTSEGHTQGDTEAMCTNRCRIRLR